MAQITDIKTPGVYVTEVPSFPPSIAQVATAVPAFIGYTEFAENLQPGDLANVPTRITSLVEYQLYFGNGPGPGFKEIDIDASNNVTSVQRKATYYMYDAIRMFFLNGGNVCYIVSVDVFGATVDAGQLMAGIDALTKYDEPTLLLFPDAVLSADLADVQTHALQQCANLQDRFCILDTDEATAGWSAGIDSFRQGVGIQNLNYGAVYTPYIKTTLPLTVTYGDIAGLVYQGGVKVDFKNLTTSTNAKNLVQSLDNLKLDSDAIKAALAAPLIVSPSKDLQEQWTVLLNAYQSTFNNTVPSDDESKYQALISFLYSVGLVINNWALNFNGDSGGLGIKADVKTLINNSLKDNMSNLLALDEGARDTIGSGSGYYNGRAILASFDDTLWGGIFSTPPASNSAIYGASPEPVQRQRALPSFIAVFNQFNLGVSQIQNLASTYQTSYEQALLQSHPVYKQIVTYLQSTSTTLPPSGAIAGVYSTVDSNRGVWKAPANISVTGVSGLTYAIDDLEQATLNVDVMAGKSVNAIRSFTGKGILVWGARTLDGNSNDFRYISVRRFYIMVEESVKLATQQFVFEPNDGNTWVRLRAMIENYLTNLWRQGALAGPKPEAAFYVKVGLGQTMTFDDILNGRMIVEIGMAPVRPAEFIILRFSQIQQQA